MRSVLIGVLICVGLSACATQSRGMTDFLRVDTIPQGAKVTTSIATKESARKHKRDAEYPLEYIGCDPTPCSIQLRRESEFIASITHDGFEPAEFYVGHALKSEHLYDDMALNVAGFTAQSTAVNVLVYGLWLEAFGVSATSSAGLSVLGPIAGSAATGGAIVGATGIVIDVATGANMNLVPNPIILKLAPEGTPIKTDPRVAEYRERQAAEKGTTQ